MRMGYDLEFKIARSEKIQELYYCLYTIIGFSGSLTVIGSSVVMCFLFTQGYSDFAIVTAWSTIIAGILTLLAMVTFLLLRVRELALLFHLKLQYYKIRRQAVQEANLRYNLEDLV